MNPADYLHDELMADDERRVEIEAVARALQGRYLGRDDWRTFADEARTAIEALDRVRDARGDDEAAKRIVAWLRLFKSPLVAPNDDAPKLWLAADYIEREFSDAARSPQSEDHEADAAERQRERVRVANLDYGQLAAEVKKLIQTQRELIAERDEAWAALEAARPPQGEDHK